MKLLWILICWPLGYLVLRYRVQVKDFMGNIDFAERYFGQGGTYLIVVLLGLLLFVLPILYVFGIFDPSFTPEIAPL